MAENSIHIANFPGFPEDQSVSGTVSVDNFPVQAEAAPAPEDIFRSSSTTTGVLIKVPNGRVWRGSLSLAASIAVAGNATCSISTVGGTILSLPLTGLALSTVSTSVTLSDVYIYASAGDLDVTFTAGASGSSMGSASGRLL